MNDKRISKYARRLMKKQFRESFVVNHINNGLAFQIREMRDEIGITQKELARRTNTKQSQISRFEDPDYGNYNINSLTRLANEFDVALQVRFVPFSQLLKDVLQQTPETLNVASYSKDAQLMDFSATPSAEDRLTRDSGKSYSIKFGDGPFSMNIRSSWDKPHATPTSGYRVN